MARRYRVLCTLPDGVEILEPKARPTHVALRDVRGSSRGTRGDGMEATVSEPGPVTVPPQGR